MLSFSTIVSSVKQFIPIICATQSSDISKDLPELAEIASCRRYFHNSMISNALPCCTVMKGKLTRCSGTKLLFSYGNENIRFSDEVTMNKWLSDQELVDLWEIDDHRGENTKKWFKLQRFGEWGFTDYRSKNAVYDQLSSDYGELWKLEYLPDGKCHYIRTGTTWFSSACYGEIKFDDLWDIAQHMNYLRDDKQKYKSKENHKKKSWYDYSKVIALGGLGLIAGRALYENNSMSQHFGIFDSSLAKCVLNTAIVYSSTMRQLDSRIALLPFLTSVGSFIDYAYAQNSPPVINAQVPNQIVPSGSNLNLELNPQLIFSDIDGDIITIAINATGDWVDHSVNPILVGSALGVADCPGPGKIILDGDTLHLTSREGGYRIYDVPSLSRIVNIANFGNDYPSFDIQGNNVYLVGGFPNGLEILDISNLRSPFLISSISVGTGRLQSITVHQNVAFISIGNTLQDEFFIYNVTNPNSLVLLQSLDVPSSRGSSSIMRLEGDILYVQDSGNLFALSILDPLNVFILANWVDNRIFTFDVREGIVYLSKCNPPSIDIVSFVNPSAPILLNSFPVVSCLGAISVGSHLVGVAEADNFLVIYQINTVGSISQFYNSSIQLFGDSFSGALSDSSLIVRGNTMFYRNSLDHVTVYDLFRGRLSGTPLPQDRGTYTVNVTATDGRGGSAFLTFNVDVPNQSPVLVNSIGDQTPLVDMDYSLSLSNTFFDPESDPITLSVSGLPEWLEYDAVNQQLLGAPRNRDLNVNSIITVGADDGQGGFTDVAFPLNVIEPIGVVNRNRSANVGAIVGGVLGSLVCCGGVGAVVATLLHRWRKEKEEFELSEFALTFDEGKENVMGVIGNKYSLLKFDGNDKEHVFRETGLQILNEEGCIGRGQFGRILVCWNREKKEYAAVKIIEGKDKFEKSSQEAELQSYAKGPHVLEIYNTIPDESNDKLYHFMPLAGLGSLDAICPLLSEMKKEQREKYCVFIAQDVLIGVKTCHNNGVYHCDLKGSNIVVNKNGDSFVTDFGCAQEHAFVRDAGIGDVRYFSPERINISKGSNSEEIDLVLSDLWAVGVLLLEVMTGKEATELLKYPVSTDKGGEEHYRNALKEVDILKRPKEGSVMEVIRGLLEIDPEERLSVDEALAMKCFKKNFAIDEKKSLFESLAKKKKDTTLTQVRVERSDKASVHLEDLNKSIDLTTLPYNAENLELPFYYNHSKEMKFYYASQNNPYIS